MSKQFEIYENEGQEAFVNSNEIELRKCLSVENEFFSLKNAKIFDHDVVVEQMKRCKCLLVEEMAEQNKKLQLMRKLRTILNDPTKKAKRANTNRKLAELEKCSWYSYKRNGTQQEYELIDLRVVGFIRNSRVIQLANVASYIRKLTRATVGSSAETVVEHFLSEKTEQGEP